MAEIEEVRPSPETLEFLSLIPAIKYGQDSYRKFGANFDEISEDSEELKVEAIRLWNFFCDHILLQEGPLGFKAICLISSLAHFGHHIPNTNWKQLLKLADLPAQNLQALDALVKYGLVNAEKLSPWYSACHYKIHSPFLMFTIKEQNKYQGREVDVIRLAFQILAKAHEVLPSREWILCTKSLWSFILNHDAWVAGFKIFGQEFCTVITEHHTDFRYLASFDIDKIAQRFRDEFGTLGIESIRLLCLELLKIGVHSVYSGLNSFPIETVFARIQEFIQIYKNAQNTNILPPGLEDVTKCFGLITRQVLISTSWRPLQTKNEIVEVEMGVALQAFELCKLSFASYEETIDLFETLSDTCSCACKLLTYLINFGEKEMEILDVLTVIGEQIRNSSVEEVLVPEELVGEDVKWFEWITSPINKVVEVFFDNKCKFKIQECEFRKPILKELVSILTSQKDLYKIHIEQEREIAPILCLLEECLKNHLYLSLSYKELEIFDESFIVSGQSNEFMLKLVDVHDLPRFYYDVSDEYLFEMDCSIIQKYIQIWSTPPNFDSEIFKRNPEIGAELLTTITTTLGLLSKPGGIFDRSVNKEKLLKLKIQSNLAKIKLNVELLVQ